MPWSCPHTERTVDAFAYLMKGRPLLWTLWFLVSESSEGKMRVHPWLSQKSSVRRLVSPEWSIENFWFISQF